MTLRGTSRPPAQRHAATEIRWPPGPLPGAGRRPRRLLLAVLLLLAGLASGRAAPATAQAAASPEASPGDWIAAGPPDPAPALDLAVDPADPDVVYLLTEAGLRVSRDGGATWQPPSLPGACALAPSPGRPARLYAVTVEPGGEPHLWRSDDQGRRWRDIAVLPGETAPARQPALSHASGGPATPSEVPVAAEPRAGTDERSAERHAPPSSAAATEAAGSSAAPRVAGAEAASVQPAPRPTRNADGPPSCAVAVDADDPDLVVLAVVDRPAVPRRQSSSDPGVPPPPAAAAPAVRLAWSRDGGSKLEALPAPPFVPLDLLFAREGTLLAAARDGVWRSADRGRTWRPARRGLESQLLAPSVESFRAVVRLAAGARPAQVLFAATEAEAGAPGNLFASRDGGDTWEPVAGLPAGDVAALLTERRGGAADPNALVVAFAGAGLWQRAEGRWNALPRLPEGDEPVALARLGFDPGELLVATAGGAVWRQAPPPPPCLDDATTLCLAGRFRVTLDAWSAGGGGAPGRALPLTPTSGWFWTTSPESPAAALRVVDVRPADVAAGEVGSEAGPWWVYWSGLSDDGFDLHVTDTVSGASRVYRQAPGAPVAGLDDASFAAAEARRGDGSAGDDGLWLASLPEGGCGDDSPDLCLGGDADIGRQDGPPAGRFRVAVDWEDGGEHGAGVGDRLSPEAGWFRFSTTGDPELFVRLVDGRAVNGSWWVLFGGLTDAAYEIRVSDQASGETVTYEVSAGEPTAHADRRAFGDG